MPGPRKKLVPVRQGPSARVEQGPSAQAAADAMTAQERYARMTPEQRDLLNRRDALMKSRQTAALLARRDALMKERAAARKRSLVPRAPEPGRPIGGPRRPHRGAGM